MILNQKFLPDARIEQEYKALESAGYRVVVLASEKGLENEGYEIIRINPNNPCSGLFNMTLSYNPYLEKQIIHKLKKNKIEKVDIIHVHDLFWSFLGFQLKRYFNCKLVIDLHENYPEMVRAFRESHIYEITQKTLKQKIKKFLRNTINPLPALLAFIRKRASSIDRLILYENRMLTKCDRFLVVVKEALDRFDQKEFCKKGVIVSNTKDPESWESVIIPPLNDKLIVNYVGTVQNLRGLDTAIVAMKYLNQEEYELNIVGIIKGSQSYRYFQKIMGENNINNVNLVEWLENESDAVSYINKSHVCIVPHKNTGLTQTTVPHKLFMYMAIGRPVLVSDVAPLKRIVSETNCGLIFKADDPVDFAEKLKEMRDINLLQTMAKNGRNAAENKYSWTKDKERLLKVYSELSDLNYK